MENFEPINEREIFIKDRLILLGISESDLQFRGTSDRRYIRYGYWKSIPLRNSQLTDLRLEEDLYEDDDGTFRGRPIYRKQYSYYIK
jgi:hypothetical protein